MRLGVILLALGALDPIALVAARRPITARRPILAPLMLALALHALLALVTVAALLAVLALTEGPLLFARLIRAFGWKSRTRLERLRMLAVPA